MPHYGKTLDEIVDRLLLEPAEINEHLYTLKRYACKCSHVTEFGVRFGRSTAAFLSARPRVLRSYDLEPLDCGWLDNDDARQAVARSGVDWRFIQGDSRQVTIERTDLLFIDTYHVYEHLRDELARHVEQCNRFILLHDTVLFSDMTRAAYEFVDAHPFTIRDHAWNNNGLMVLERRKRCELW